MDPASKRLYEMKAEMIQAVGHPIRLAIVECLRNGEQCVCDIAAHVGAKRPNVSRHLAVMLKAGVVDSRKEGLRVLYSLRTPCILKFLGCVTDVLKQRVKSEKAALASR